MMRYGKPPDADGTIGIRCSSRSVVADRGFRALRGDGDFRVGLCEETLRGDPTTRGEPVPVGELEPARAGGGEYRVGDAALRDRSEPPVGPEVTNDEIELTNVGASGCDWMARSRSPDIEASVDRASISLDM
jgi:hypothetical protein